ncbi:hypothetical protein LguiA_025950 [Lonicera macranthoides]
MQVDDLESINVCHSSRIERIEEELRSCPRGLHCKDEVDVASTSLLITLVRVFSQIEDAEDILWVVKAITARLIDCKVDQEQSCDCERNVANVISNIQANKIGEDVNQTMQGVTIPAAHCSVAHTHSFSSFQPVSRLPPPSQRPTPIGHLSLYLTHQLTKQSSTTHQLTVALRSSLCPTAPATTCQRTGTADRPLPLRPSPPLLDCVCLRRLVIKWWCKPGQGDWLSFGNGLEKSCWAWSHESPYIIGQLKVKMQFLILNLSRCLIAQQIGSNITGFRPVIDLACMRDVVNKLSIHLLDHRFPKAVAQVALTLRSTWEVVGSIPHCHIKLLTWNSLFLVVFNADSVLGTDSRTSMNSQVTKPGNIAEDSSIISAREHFKTSHGYFIHPQGSKELVGSLETKWKTTNQYLLKEHAWLQCTRRCMFALVPQLNNLLMKLLQNLIINILSFGQCRTSIENTPTTDTGLLSNLHVFLLVHNSHPPPCRLNCLRQQKVENLVTVGSLENQLGSSILVRFHVTEIMQQKCVLFCNLSRKLGRLSNSKSVQLGRVRLPGGNSSKRDYCYALERSRDSTLRVKQLVNAVSEKVIRAVQCPQLDILSLHTTEDPAVMPQTRQPLTTSVQSKPPLNWLEPLSNQKLTALHPSSVTLQLLQNLIMSILSFRQCRTSIANTPKSIHNIRNDAQQILVYSQTSIASLLKVSPSHVGYCWQSGKRTSCVGCLILKTCSLEWHDFLEAIRPREITAMVRVDVARSENEVQANTDIEFQRNNEISTFVRLGHQLDSTIFSLLHSIVVLCYNTHSQTVIAIFIFLVGADNVTLVHFQVNLEFCSGYVQHLVQNQPWLIRPSSGELVELHLATVGSSLCVKVASTKVAHFLVFMLVNSDSGTVEKHLNCQEEERYQVLRFKRMEMSASESGESALSDLLKLNTSGGLSKHRRSLVVVNALAYATSFFTVSLSRCSKSILKDVGDIHDEQFGSLDLVQSHPLQRLSHFPKLIAIGTIFLYPEIKLEVGPRLSWGCNVCLKGFRYYGSNVTYALVDIKCKLNFRLMLKRYALYWNYRASRD